MAHTLTKSNFDDYLNGCKAVLADFWADWCGPCRMVGPAIEDLHNEYDGKAIVGKVNVDEENELAMRYQVMTIPTIIIFKDGQIAERVVGVRSKRDFAELLEKYI